MSFDLNGYLLEPPRIGSSNSPYTASPNNLVSNQSDWDLAYPSDESAPNDHYMAIALADAKLPQATFGWTKNETLNRFDYNGRGQRFQPLPGGTPDILGVIDSNSNTKRIKAPKLVSADLLLFPVRLSASGTGSGFTFHVFVVADEAHFLPNPGPGHVEIALDTGTLNWCPDDLVTYDGCNAVWQRQTFHTIAQSAGDLGTTLAMLLLAPLPISGQYPLIRLGYGPWLVAVERAHESAFSADPAHGTVEWAADTGRLKFNLDESLAGKEVYYDGVLLQTGIALPSVNLGLVSAPLPLYPPPVEGGDIIFQAALSGSPTYQFVTTIFVDAPLDPLNIPPGTIQIERGTGNIGASPQDVLDYGLYTLTAFVCDLPLEHGVSLRLYRSPADPGGVATTINDVTAFYRATEATLVSPITGNPMVFLPSIPFESNDPAKALKVMVEQGTGSFISDDFPNLLTASPTDPLTYGYTLDYAGGQLNYALRRVDCLIDRSVVSASTPLIDGLVAATNLALALEQPSGGFQPLDLTKDAFIEPLSGVVYFTKTAGSLVAHGARGSFSHQIFPTDRNIFTDANAGLGSVLTGDLLYISSETVPNTIKGVYQVISVLSPSSVVVDVLTWRVDAGPLTFEVRRGSETLADRYFVPVVLADPFTKVERFPLLGDITNGPVRLRIPTKWISPTVRFRYGAVRYSSVVNLVEAFSPGVLPVGTVEVLRSTGDLNFAQVDVELGGSVYCGHTLAMGTDYQITAELGLIAFTDRMLEREEGLITYVPSATGTLTTEKMCFLVRKELTQAHPTPTSVLSFNPYRHFVADVPVPAVFRGGRPQDTTQVGVSAQTSTITFYPDQHLDGLLPHGAIVDPTENVYIDYYIYDAIGGEQTTYVQNPPITLAQVNITEGSTSFGVQGDWTTTFQAGYALRLDKSEVHVIGSSVLAHEYQGVSYPYGITVVSLESHDYFRDSWQKPALFVSSGLLRGNFFWTYFVPNIGTYNMVPRGATTITFEGDCTGLLRSGVILKWEYGSVLDYNLVSGAGYDIDTDTTIVTLASPAARQYYGVTLRRSIRPIFEATTKETQTSLVPVQTNMPALPSTMRNVLVYSRKDGERGIALSTPQDYVMDDSGHITFQQALMAHQEWCILYTGHQNIAADLSLKASYTAGVVPTEDNGLIGQALRANYTTFSPDSFYYRVVRMLDFRNELAAELGQEAAASTATAGPMLSNTGGATLYNQGQPSAFFTEGHLANDDIVARSTLKFYNDSINLLEDILQDLDGRLVGGEDGRFKFDGSITNPKNPLDPTQPFVWATVTNQIDNLIKVLDAPYSIVWDTVLGWEYTALGTYVQAYQASQWSRFYPTWQRRFGVTTIGHNTGDSVMDTGSKNLTNVSNLRTRLAWAVTTEPASATQNTLVVDNATGSKVNIRPTFKSAMTVQVQARDGTVLAPSLLVTSVTNTSLVCSTPLGVDIPMGCTVSRSPDDTFGLGPPITDDAVTTYMAGRDFSYDPTSGQITYIKPYPPLDGTDGVIPEGLWCHPLPPKTALSCNVTLNNADTAPAKIPALYGGATDDDGEVLFPIQSPTFVCESTLDNTAGYLADEHALIKPNTGFIRHVTVDPILSQGDLDSTHTIITVTGTALATVVQRYDLVRIIPDAPGVPTDFHQVLSSTPTTITVDYPFDAQYMGFTFVLATAPDICGGVGATIHDRTLTDTAANFLTSGVLAGHTIIVTGGVYASARHQVSKIVSDTELEFEYPEPATVQSCNYRVSNTLSTFGSFAGTGTLLDRWQADLTGELGVTEYNVAPPLTVNGEVQALYQFFDLVFTDIATGTGAVDNVTLTDPTAHFVTARVKETDLVYLNSGLNLGFYPVATVVDETHLTVSTPFLTMPSTVYRVGRPFGVSNGTLTKLMSELKLIYPFVHDTESALTLAQTAVPIIGSYGGAYGGSFARGFTGLDLDMRNTVSYARMQHVIPTFKSTVENSLQNGDSLYDRRYTWINARINLETGLVVQILRAKRNRMKKSLTAIYALTMLTAVSPSS